VALIVHRIAPHCSVDAAAPRSLVLEILTIITLQISVQTERLSLNFELIIDQINKQSLFNRKIDALLFQIKKLCLLKVHKEGRLLIFSKFLLKMKKKMGTLFGSSTNRREGDESLSLSN
jgi:hypothetical protein